MRKTIFFWIAAIVTWGNTTRVSVPCPDGSVYGDLHMHCAVYHYKEVYKEQNRTFDKYEEAEAFYKKYFSNTENMKLFKMMDGSEL